MKVYEYKQIVINKPVHDSSGTAVIPYDGWEYVDMKIKKFEAQGIHYITAVYLFKKEVRQ